VTLVKSLEKNVKKLKEKECHPIFFKYENQLK